MTDAEYRAAAYRTRLQARSLRMARSVLVEGLSAAEAARREGLTRQAAHMAAQTVLRAHRAAGGYPRSWRAVTVVVPPEVEEQVRALADEAMREAGLL